ncbi:MAG: heat shock protein HspQ, partial [Verrucomicrobiota bacterium]|nr:heat shock protein HspQ [Verrucomicrobiota bacterium]
MLIRLSDFYGGASPNIFYDLGLVVTHQNYGYRGVIVAVDPVCMAGDTWYNTNKTQPNRNQPWYHILVDGNQQVTYVAQSNLVYDQLEKPVIHPMLNLFFSGHDEE